MIVDLGSFLWSSSRSRRRLPFGIAEERGHLGSDEGRSQAVLPLSVVLALALQFEVSMADRALQSLVRFFSEAGVVSPSSCISTFFAAYPIFLAACLHTSAAVSYSSASFFPADPLLSLGRHSHAP